MSCIAGLWWDQSRRMCVSPSEVPCNPYNIINNQGAGKRLLFFKRLNYVNLFDNDFFSFTCL